MAAIAEEGQLADQMYLVEARRARRGDEPAGIARFVLIAGSPYAALSKLRVFYDTTGLDSLTAEPVSGVLPIAGALVHEMVRRTPESRKPSTPSTEDEDQEPWMR